MFLLNKVWGWMFPLNGVWGPMFLLNGLLFLLNGFTQTGACAIEQLQTPHACVPLSSEFGTNQRVMAGLWPSFWGQSA